MGFLLAELVVQIAGNHSPLDRSLGIVKSNLMGLAKVGTTAMGGLGLAVAGVSGALGAAGLGYAMYKIIDTASDLESRMIALGKATDLEGDALKKMKDSLFALSTSLKGISLEDLLDIATTGAKMGVATEDLLKYAEGIAKVSTAIDDMPADQIADRIGGLNTVFKLGVEGVMQLGSAIDKLADSGMSTASGILNVSSRIMGMSVGAKISAQETLALSAALLDTKTEAELAASALLDFISSLNQVEGRKGMAKTLGMDAKAFADLVETKPIVAIQNFLAALKQMDAATQLKTLASIGIKGDTHASEIMKLAQVSDNLSKYVGMANHEFLTLDQSTKSYGVTAESTRSKIKVMQNQLEILADRIGSALLPAVNTGLSLAGDLASGIGGIFDRVRETVSGLGIDVTGYLETLGYGLRNYADLFELTGVKLGGVLSRTWAYLEYGGEVVGAVAKYIWESLVEAFQIAMVAASNAKDNLVSIFKEIWDYVKSGFKDPIEFKLKGVLDGIDLQGDGKFQMPQMGEMPSTDNQEDEIHRRIAGREEERNKAATAVGGAKGGPPKDGGGNNGPDTGNGKIGRLSVPLIISTAFLSASISRTFRVPSWDRSMTTVPKKRSASSAITRSAGVLSLR
jgi:TP901 family phage tail tape measure protein